VVSNYIDFSTYRQLFIFYGRGKPTAMQWANNASPQAARLTKIRILLSGLRKIGAITSIKENLNLEPIKYIQGNETEAAKLVINKIVIGLYRRLLCLARRHKLSARKFRLLPLEST